MQMTSPDTPTMPLNAVERIAGLIAHAPGCQNAEARARARRAVLDTIGCMFVGIGEATPQVVLASAQTWGSGDAVVAGSDVVLPAPWAALVNGTAAKAFDFDDWDEPGLTHTTSVLLPALLAAFDGTEATGADLIDAHIVGVEVIMRLGEAVNPGHYALGWHATSTVGAIGAAAACARAMRLTQAQAANAIALSTSMAGGFTSQFGSAAKPMHAGLAAKAGFMSASLAKHGATGIADTLDGPVSFLSMMTKADRADVDRAMAQLGQPWAIIENGLHVKLFPSCGGTHRVVQAAIELFQAHNLANTEIASVEINVPDYLADLLPYAVPDTVEQALFSFSYCVAAALIHGRLGIDEFTDAAIRDQSVRALASRVIISTRQVPHRERVFVKDDFDTIEVTTADGSKLNAAVDIPHGAPPNFATDDDVRAKFDDLAGRVTTGEHAQALSKMILASKKDWPISELMRLLRLALA